MSIKAWGFFELHSTPVSVQQSVELAFKVTMIALQNRIGVKLGGNVSSYVRNELRAEGDSPSHFVFELTDDPLDVNAESLLVGDGVPLLVSGQRVDTGEALNSRMSRLQSFLESVLSNEVIKNMVLHINSGFGEQGTLEVKAGEFRARILELYERGNNWTPTMKFIVSK